MKKKIFTFIITGFLTLAFLGCGGNDKKEIEMAEILQGRMGDY